MAFIKIKHTLHSSSQPTEQFTFLLIWWLCFIAYPMWYLPGLDWSRLIVFLGLILFMTGCSLLLRAVIATTDFYDEDDSSSANDTYFFAALFSVAFICHVPFLNLPILTGLDTIDHAVIPALVADRFVDSISSVIGFNIQYGLLALFLILLIGIPVFSRWRKAISLTYKWISSKLINHYWETFLWIAGISFIYAMLLNLSSLPDQFGDLGSIFRYPPLSKIILIPCYFFMGLQEWVGRIVQIAFTFAGAYYLYRLTLYFFNSYAARLACCIYVFLPPIFHYGNTHMIEGGTLFFVIAAFFHLMRYIEDKNRFDLLWGTIFCVCGCLYKHPAVSVIPAFALMAAYDFLFPKKGCQRTIFPAVLACSIASITVLLYMKLSSFNSDIPSKISFPTITRIGANLSAIPQGISWPLAVLFLIGLTFLFMKKYTRTGVLFIAWIGVHFMLSCMSTTYRNVRQALPYYVGLIPPAAFFLSELTSNRTWLKIGVVYVLLPLTLIWADFVMDRDQSDPVKGRAMGDRSYITFGNWERTYLPYGEVIQDLKKRTQSGDTIYAPMANEPVAFYLAKYDFENRDYVRSIEAWEPDIDKQSLESLYEFCRNIEADWLLVPTGRWLAGYANSVWIDQLFSDPPPYFEFITRYASGTEVMGLWKVVHK